MGPFYECLIEISKSSDQNCINKKSNLLFEFFKVYLMVARLPNERFGNIGEGGLGEKVSDLIFWNLKAIAIVQLILKMDTLSN